MSRWSDNCLKESNRARNNYRTQRCNCSKECGLSCGCINKNRICNADCHLKNSNCVCHNTLDKSFFDAAETTCVQFENLDDSDYMKLVCQNVRQPRLVSSVYSFDYSCTTLLSSESSTSWPPTTTDDDDCLSTRTAVLPDMPSPETIPSLNETASFNALDSSLSNLILPESNGQATHQTILLYSSNSSRAVSVQLDLRGLLPVENVMLLPNFTFPRLSVDTLPVLYVETQTHDIQMLPENGYFFPPPDGWNSGRIIVRWRYNN